MKTISVKLSEDTRSRLERIAAEEGTTPHALMVSAIEGELERREKRSSFYQDAMQARAEMIASGKAYDGKEMIAYLRARARGESPAKPKLKSLKTLMQRKP
ncbi:CopG family ribbon-helix-helix protein [Ramlibacter sp.]|uniref:CopG family ribbon-helix-helix protein n=1 Tax=Ramlibacter sp. TaxID=1917967 RepID=UPI003D0AEF7C